MPDTRARDQTASQLIQYAGLGAVGTAGHYLTLVLLAEWSGFDLILATTLGFAVGAVINYLLNYHLLFRSRRRHVVALPRFLLIAALGALINAVVFAAMLATGVHYLLAQVIATGAVVIVTFLANRRWTFGDRPGRGDASGQDQ